MYLVQEVIYMKNGSKLRASMAALLLLITVPLVAALYASIIFSSTQMKKIEAQDEEVYFEMLYNISSDLINADRDLYQAMLAGTQYQAYHDYVTAEQLATYVEDYNNNAQQAIDGVNKAAAIAQKDASERK